MVMDLLLLITACIVIWFSTGYAIDAVEKLSSHLHLSKFTLALFVLGTITSLPEMAITLNSVVLRTPQIAIGNLIGSQVFLLFLVVPVLAIVSKGLHLKLQLQNVSLALTLLVALVPMMALYNQGLEFGEVLIILGIYVVFVLNFTRQENFLKRVAERIQYHPKLNTTGEILKLLAALGVLLLASNTAVREIINIASVLQTPRFLLSLIILPIATNLPELSLAFGSLAMGKKDVALGDYMGSLTFNSLLIAVLTLGMGGELMIGQNIHIVIILFIIGVVVFWWSCFSKNLLSIKEGLLLLLCYFILVVAAAWQVMSVYAITK
jgi:cation:H+ antiporter